MIYICTYLLCFCFCFVFNPRLLYLSSVLDYIYHHWRVLCSLADAWTAWRTHVQLGGRTDKVICRGSGLQTTKCLSFAVSKGEKKPTIYLTLYSYVCLKIISTSSIYKCIYIHMHVDSYFFSAFLYKSIYLSTLQSICPHYLYLSIYVHIYLSLLPGTWSCCPGWWTGRPRREPRPCPPVRRCPGPRPPSGPRSARCRTLNTFYISVYLCIYLSCLVHDLVATSLCHIQRDTIWIRSIIQIPM